MTPPRADASSPGRRIRYGLRTLVLVAAAAVSCLLVAVLGSRYHWRADVTATRQHTLAQRTLALLARAPDATTIAVSADNRRLSREARTRLADLLASFTDARPDLATVWIDTGAAGGPAAFEGFLRELADRDSPRLEAQRQALQAIAEQLPALSGSLGDLAQILKDAADLAPKDVDVERQSALVRIAATRIDGAAKAIPEALAHTIAGVPIPDLDRAREASLVPLDEAARIGAAISAFASRLTPDPSSGNSGQRLRALRAQADQARDAAASLADALNRIESADLLSIGRLLASSDAVVVTSDAGSVAIDFAALFPAADPAAPGAPAFAGEQLLSSALASLVETEDPPPAIVFLHAERGKLFDADGIPTAPARRAFGKLFDRLRLGRHILTEWAVALDPAPPSESALAGEVNRPIVWVVLGAPSAADIDPRQPGAASDRLERISKLGQAVKRIVDEGRSALVSIEPSDLPSVGDPDPIAKALEPLGITIDTARTIIRSEAGPQGRSTSVHQFMRGTASSHPIAAALDGLPFAALWCSPITIESQVNPAGSVTPIYRINPSSEVWAESQWMLMRQAQARGLFRPLQPALLAEPPALDPVLDRAAPTDPAGWIIAAACERDGDGQRPLQRIVAVASASWFDDALTQWSDTASGRRVALYPGNSEFFDASIQWLAGRDDMIAPGPRDLDVSRIGPIPSPALTALRWFLIAGMPTLVLIAGAAARIIRR